MSPASLVEIFAVAHDAICFLELSAHWRRLVVTAGHGTRLWEDGIARLLH